MDDQLLIYLGAAVAVGTAYEAVVMYGSAWWHRRHHRVGPTPYLCWSAIKVVFLHPELDWRQCKLIDQEEARRQIAARATN
jgi:hypothetical protein